MNAFSKTIGLVTALIILAATSQASAFSFGNDKFKSITPKEGSLTIPVSDISDGMAHYYKIKADDGIVVSFFTVKSQDGIIRAAVDSCDVCYRSGKGYIQEGNMMVCTNCGLKFQTSRINEVKGGCNPAPLARTIENNHLVISMKDINANSWYCKFKKQ